MNTVDVNASFDAIKAALSKALPQSELQKAWTQSQNPTTGLTMYSLEAPAKMVVPQVTPLRNRIPRVTGGQGIQANWRAITALSTAMPGIGVSEGRRGGLVEGVVTEYYAKFVQLGVESAVSFEAQLAGEGFDDVKARAVQGMLMHLMMGEEQVILAGQGTFGLGVTPTPVLATSVSGGTLAAATNVFVRVVALTLEGYMAAKAGMVRGSVARSNADGSTDNYGSGAAGASNSATVATGGAGAAHSVTASVTPVRGAMAYAWFVGSVDGSAGNLRLHDVTTINSTVIRALPGGGNLALPADLVGNDRSANGLVHDGYIGIAARAGSGSYFRHLDTGVAGVGSPLTSDGAGGIVEFDDALRWFWDNLRLSPSEIWVSSEQAASMRKLILAAGSAATQRFTFVSAQGDLKGGGKVRGYINVFGMGAAPEIPIESHPYLPPGTVLFLTHQLPYPVSNIGQTSRILCRRDYHQLDWPLRTRMHEMGAYTDQVLQHYFPPSIGVISNIAKG
jgi:hypothetical protein